MEISIHVSTLTWILWKKLTSSIRHIEIFLKSVIPIYNSKESLLLLFDDFRKVKTKYIVLYLNALTKFRSAREASRLPVLMENCQTCSHISVARYHRPMKGLLLVCSRWFAGHERGCRHRGRASWEECKPEFYTDKSTQKCNKYVVVYELTRLKDSV